MTYLFLGIIAIGVLLMSEGGKKILRAGGTLFVLGVLGILGFVLWIYVDQYKEQIWSGATSVIQIVLFFAIFGWANAYTEKVSKIEDKELNEFQRFIKHTSTGAMVVYVFLFLALIEYINSFLHLY